MKENLSKPYKMIDLTSYLDGIRVLMGPWILNAAALFTMVAIIRPAVYYEDNGDVDEARTRRAK